MKTAIIYSIPIDAAPGYGWRWRSENSKEESAEWFLLYADCIEDAKRNGYAVEPVQVQAGLKDPARDFKLERS